MAKDVKKSAEEAREARKARIEKTTKNQIEKAEKKANQSKAKKRAKILVPTIIVVLALVIGLLYYFGVPHRTFSAVKYSDGTKVSVAEYEYYYKSLYSSIFNQAVQYEQMYSAYYGEGAGLMATGFDYTKTPKNQEYTLSEEYTGIALDEDVYGENPTWADFFKEYALLQAKTINSLYASAQADGYELPEDTVAEIDEEIEDLRETAAESNYSLNAYLMNNYGRGMNESLLREIITKQQTVSLYLTDKETEYTDSVTADDIEAAFDENPGEYSTMNLRYYYFEAEVAENTEAQEATDTTEAVEGTDYTDEELEAMTEENMKEAKADAEEFLSLVNLSNFDALAYSYAEEDYKDYYDTSSENYSSSYTTFEDYNYSTLVSNINEDAADWAFSDERVVGDKQVFELPQDDGCTLYFVLVVSSLPERDESIPVDVRHILVAFEYDEDAVDEDGNATTETVTRTDEEAKALAEQYLNEWLEGDKTEDSFAELASQYSDDSGSVDNGGLYEAITPSSSYVDTFLNWCIDTTRKVGDYEIIKTEYGYHIMYLSAISEMPQWQLDVKEAIASQKTDDFYTGIVDSDAYNEDVKVSDSLITRIQNRLEDFAADYIKQVQAEMEEDSTTTSTDE